MTKRDDEAARRAILARRARFVAAAVASVGIACGKTTSTDPPPAPCLSVPIQTDAEPRPCLKVALPEDARAPEPPPQPCLSIAIQPDAQADAGAKPKVTK